MKTSGLYYVADHAPSSSATDASTFQTLISTIQAKYATTSLPRWSLEHRLQRTTPSTSGEAKPAAYHHVINFSYHPGKTYLHTHPAHLSQAGPDNVVVAIPAAQTESFLTLLNTKLSALWTQRQALVVREGLAFAVGELVVRVGELRSARGVGGSPPALQGVVVCIESRIGDAITIDDSDNTVMHSDRSAVNTVKEAHEMIKAVWSDLDVQARKEGIKEVLSQYEGPREEQADWAEVRMWCEVLKLRS